MAVRTWKCEVCGYVHEGPTPPETCPVCGVDKDLFSPLELLGVSPAPVALQPRVGWRCTVCGYEHDGEQPPESCPVCKVDAGLFERTGTTASAVEPEGPRIVIVGAGIAGVVAAARARETSPGASIVLVSNQAELPYYRLNLTRLLAGEVTEQDLPLHPQAWFEDHRIQQIEGDCTSIDRASKLLDLRGGQRIAYDRLVLANGSHPFVPPLPGATRQGVHAFRTVRDSRALLSHAGDGRRCVVIGGGLLGLEAAGALRKRGCTVVVLEGFGWLLPRQLAEPAGRMLEAHLEKLGIEVRCHARVKELVGDESVRGVKLENEVELAADFVVLATGVRPNTYLARRCGLQVQHGVVVNDRMATSDPNVFAAGDVVEHRGQVPGLWPFAYAQGAVAGTNAAGGNAELHAMPASNQLKVLDVQMFSIGQVQPSDGSYRVLEETGENRYVRLVCRDGALVGANLYGDASLAGVIREAVESGKQILENAELLRKVPGLRNLCDGAS